MKRFWVAALAAVAMTGAAQAQQFFRIGTGGTAGTYYPVGGMIANAVSQPGKIIATAQASNGSLANVTAVAGGALESGFTQSDVATWAYTGTGAFEGKPKVTDLRMIANLYPESIHLVVKQGLGHQDRGRPQGQARRAGRAGLGHADRCTHDPGRLRREGSRHQARVHQAEPGRRQAEGRLARRVLLRRRRTGRRDRRAGLERRRHRTAAARPARKPRRCARPAPSSRSTTSRPTPTRTWPRCRRSPSARSW